MCNLIERLGPDSETAAEVAGLTLEERAWKVTDYLLANVIDVMQANLYVLQASNSKRGASIPKPRPTPRPQDRKRSSRPPLIGRVKYTGEASDGSQH